MRFVVYAVTDSCLSVQFQALIQHCDSLYKQETDSNIGLVARIVEARKFNLMICRCHGMPDDFVLNLSWKVFEGEDILVLMISKNKFCASRIQVYC